MFINLLQKVLHKRIIKQVYYVVENTRHRSKIGVKVTLRNQRSLSLPGKNGIRFYFEGLSRTLSSVLIDFKPLGPNPWFRKDLPLPIFPPFLLRYQNVPLT